MIQFSPPTGPRAPRLKGKPPVKKRQWAAAMRKAPTRGERAFWKIARKNRLGAKFERQKVILGWIADAYCDEASLIVEIDGGGHDFTKDARRTSVLNAAGYGVLRFRDDEVLEFPDRVAGIVQMVLDTVRHHSK